MRITLYTFERFPFGADPCGSCTASGRSGTARAESVTCCGATLSAALLFGSSAIDSFSTVAGAAIGFAAAAAAAAAAAGVFGCLFASWFLRLRSRLRPTTLFLFCFCGLSDEEPVPIVACIVKFGQVEHP